MNYDDRDDDGDENGKKDGKYDNNAASGSVSDASIFDPITMNQSYG